MYGQIQSVTHLKDHKEWCVILDTNLCIVRGFGGPGSYEEAYGQVMNVVLCDDLIICNCIFV